MWEAIKPYLAEAGSVIVSALLIWFRQKWAPSKATPKDGE